ncbi:MAG: glycosyltransferase family 4 protein [Fimbriimonadaceae bacterium]|nr:glycosyltransferase family 4 protein [Fimbriimonadaceae bacterium]
MSAEKPLRILQVVSSSATSGAERHVINLSDLLRRNGHHVEVVCPPGWLPGYLEAHGIPAHVSHMRGQGWFRTLGLVMRKIRESEIDVVHSHLTRATYFGAIGGVLRKTPVVASVHIGNHDQIYKRMCHGKNRLVAVSNYVRGLLHGRGIHDRFIDTVYNGTDFVDIAPASALEVRSEFGLQPDRKVVGLIGRVCREKGHLIMVDAMQQLRDSYPDAHVMFVGRVEQQFETEVRAAIRDANLQDRITMTGVRHDVPRLLDAVDFTAMPSERETFGIAAIEAMARAKPVVASRVGGLMEVVRHQQTGLLVDLRPEALAEAMAYLLEHDKEREKMGEMGRKLVQEKFTLQRMLESLETVYNKATE